MSLPGSAVAAAVRPDSIAEVVDVLRHTRPASVLPRGAGTKLDWGAVGAPIEVDLDLRGLAGIVEYNPGDLVVRAMAGTPLDVVQADLAEHGQFLALDPPEAGATLGGIVAAGASGPRRHRYGTARDLLIGVAAVLADGTVARAGGKVVKNVAGYDLMKIYTGSFGTLGVIVETTWRLHPRPPDRRVVTFAGHDGALVRRLMHSALTPTAVEALGEALVVVFEGLTPAVRAQADAAARLGEGVVTTTVPAGFGVRPWLSDGIGLKIAYEITGLDVVLAALRRLPGTRVVGRVGVGVLEAGLPAIDRDQLDRLRAVVARVGGTVVVLAAPEETKRRLDVWGPVGDALPLMRRVKDQFDPEHRLAPGRFVGGI